MTNRKPDVMLNLPPIADATAIALRDAFLEAASAMVAAGYHPAVICRAMIGCGTCIALDMAGERAALDELLRAEKAVFDLSEPKSSARGLH